MANYHINPDTGRAGQCQAKTPEACKYSIESGTVVAHYETKEEAKAAYEKLNEHKTLNSMKKSAAAKNKGAAKTKTKAKPDTLQENRKKLAAINTKANGLTTKLQKKKFYLMDLNKSLTLDKTKEARDKIYEEIKNKNEEILVLSKERKDVLAEQRELAQTIERQQRQDPHAEESSTTRRSGYTDRLASFNERFFSGGCGGGGGC